MSAFLQFNCLIHDETARKAIESYVGILQEAFQQYQNLWGNYIKLQEKYEQCNVHSSSLVKIDKPCTEIKDEQISQRQLNNSTITQEESISLLELDTLNVDSVNLKSNTGDESPPHPRESPCKDTDSESAPRSPVFSRTCLKTGSISVKKFARSPKLVLECNNLMSDMKTHRSSEKVSSEYNQKLEISTSQHVETTFLPNGKRLKQSRLVFHPIKCNEKISVQKASKPASILPKVEQESIQDISIVKTSVATENNATDINETFEDVIEISPTQRNITSKVTRRLRLKRKTSAKQTIKSSSNKYKCYDPVSSIAPKIMIDTIDFALCSSPEHTSIEMEDDKSLVGNMTNTVVNALKDKVNVSNLSPIKMCSETNVQIKKEDQSITNKVQNIAEKNNAFIYEDESFYLPTKVPINKNDTDDFNLDDTENKPPVKKASLTKFDVLLQRKENVSEQINMRCKADRAKLNGWDCWECEEYYKNLLLSKDELQKRKNQCSRHRHKYERPSTPEGFWDPEFPETLSSTYRQNKT
ncbi:DNA endonuclease RBBP8 [Formica fusca]